MQKQMLKQERSFILQIRSNYPQEIKLNITFHLKESQPPTIQQISKVKSNKNHPNIELHGGQNKSFFSSSIIDSSQKIRPFHAPSIMIFQLLVLKRHKQKLD